MRHFLFIGSYNYIAGCCEGGMDDYQGGFDTLEEAKQKALELVLKDPYGPRGEIVVLQDGELAVICRFTEFKKSTSEIVWE